MKKNLLFSVVLLCYTYCARGQCTFEQFYNYFPMPKNRMIALSDGGFLCYGTAVKDTVDFGLTETDMVLIKTDSCGRLVWINDEGYLADGDPDMEAIEMDSGNIMIVGYTAAGLPGSMGNIRVGKYNKNGQLLKEKLLIGNPVSAPYGVVKNRFKPNSYMIYGYSQNVGTSIQKPMLIEIEGELNTIRSKQYGNKESIGHLLVKDNNTLIVTLGTETNTSLMYLDSTFAIQKSVSLNRDSILQIGFYLNQLYWSKDSNSIVGWGVLQRDEFSSKKDCFMNLDLEGNLLKVVYLPDSLFSPTSMSPTHDGGYILGPQMVKTDSNFRIEWIKPTRGILGSVVQLPDGGYVGGGLSDARTQSWGEGFYEMYLVRTDKNGNYIRSGISEAGKGNAPQVLIYPNPANTHITIYTSLSYQAIKVYNLTGNKVFEQNYHPENTYIDIADVAQGLYILQLVGESGAILHTQKLSIQH